MKKSYFSIILVLFTHSLTLCASDLDIKITQPNKITCNGKIDLTILGGYAPYDIEWTGQSGFIKSETGSTGSDGKEDINQLCANSTYCVNITDALCGVLSYCWTMSECPDITVDCQISKQNPSNCNATDGNIFVNFRRISGGTGPYTLELRDGKGNVLPLSFWGWFNLKSGYYYLVAIDVDGCEGVQKITLLSDDAFLLEEELQHPCLNQSNGSVKVAAHNFSQSGEKYLFKWSTGFEETKEVFEQSIQDNLPEGRYCVTVTSDLNTCLIEACYDLKSQHSGPLTMSPVLIRPCEGKQDGSIKLNVKGGTLPYQYTWDPPTIGGLYLKAGNYCVTVTDYCGVTLNDCFEIKSLDVDLTYEILCENKGTATVNPKFGNPPYRILWSTGSNGNSIDNLGDGTYRVDVFDAKNCHLYRIFTLQYEKRISLINLKNNTSCTGNTASCDGLISLTSKNNETFTYKWSGPNSFTSNQNTILNLCPGIYNVTATDAIGCEEILSYNICCCTTSNTDYQKCIDAQISFTDDIKFPATQTSADGYIHLITSNNNIIFKWTLPDGSIKYSKDLDNLNPGRYTVEASNGCMKIEMLYILKACSEKNIKILPTVYHTCIGYNFGEIEIKLSGDVKQPVKYLWEDGSSNAVRRNLGKGSYTVLVTDADKCTDQMTIAITDEIPLTNSPKTDPCVTQYYCRQYEAYNVPSALPPECGYLDLTDCRKYICRCPLTQQIMANPNRTDNYKELRVKSSENCTIEGLCPGDGFEKWQDAGIGKKETEYIDFSKNSGGGYNCNYKIYCVLGENKIFIDNFIETAKTVNTGTFCNNAKNMCILEIYCNNTSGKSTLVGTECTSSACFAFNMHKPSNWLCEYLDKISILTKTGYDIPIKAIHSNTFMEYFENNKYESNNEQNYYIHIPFDTMNKYCALYANTSYTLSNIALTLENKFKIFPNPTTDKIFIKIFLPNQSNISLNLLNVNQQLLQKSEYKIEENNNFLELSMVKYKPGLYFIHLYSDSQFLGVQKIILQ